MRVYVGGKIKTPWPCSRCHVHTVVNNGEEGVNINDIYFEFVAVCFNLFCLVFFCQCAVVATAPAATVRVHEEWKLSFYLLFHFCCIIGAQRR